MKIALHAYEVTIKDALTWGDIQRIQSVVASGAKINAGGLDSFDSNALLEAKYKALELAVVEIKGGEQTFPFSREWMDALSVEDGNILFDAVDGLSKKK